MNGSYVVRTKTPTRFFAWIGLMLFMTLAGLLAWLHISGGGESVGTMIMEYGACFVLAALCAYAIYRERRPRIVVQGDALVCFPRWKRRQTAFIGEITSRRVTVGTTLPTRDSSGGPGFYGTMCYEITYIAGEKELITIHTRMENANRFDSAVKKVLAGRSDM